MEVILSRSGGKGSLNNDRYTDGCADKMVSRSLVTHVYCCFPCGRGNWRAASGDYGERDQVARPGCDGLQCRRKISRASFCAHPGGSLDPDHSAKPPRRDLHSYRTSNSYCLSDEHGRSSSAGCWLTTCINWRGTFPYSRRQLTTHRTWNLVLRL